jgi:hypothetical protein
MGRASFSLTAAGQPRIFTGFPLGLARLGTSADHKIWWWTSEVNPYVVVRPDYARSLAPMRVACSPW